MWAYGRFVMSMIIWQCLKAEVSSSMRILPEVVQSEEPSLQLPKRPKMMDPIYCNRHSKKGNKLLVPLQKIIRKWTEQRGLDYKINNLIAHNRLKLSIDQ